MSSDTTFFRIPFAVEGDRLEIPAELQVNGEVSFATGYGYDYERNPENDPLAKDIERLKLNWLLGAVTAAIRQYQVEGAYRFITPEKNNGNPYPYRRAARCLHEIDGQLDLYESLVENNTSVPTDTAKWRRVSALDLVPVTRKISTAAPLDGGGVLSKDLTISLAAATEGDTLVFKNGAWAFGKASSSDLVLCEFYSFRHPDPRSGFYPRQGGLLENAAITHPEAWAYLQTVEGQKLCKTEAAWQEMTTATWHTNADGTKIGWNGIGGAPFYAPNLSTGALRLPDTRGMIGEDSGCDGLGAGGTHGDGIRNITGSFYARGIESSQAYADGVFSYTAVGIAYNQHSSNTNNSPFFKLEASRQVPTTTKNQPRAWGSLACVYLGQPAS